MTNRIALEKVRLSLTEVVPNEVDLRVDQLPDGNRLALQFHTFIAGMGGEFIDVEEQWPADWWQAFRERWAPRWWLKRHPVQYKSVRIHRRVYEKVCPHIHLPGDRNPACLNFFREE